MCLDLEVVSVAYLITMNLALKKAIMFFSLTPLQLCFCIFFSLNFAPKKYAKYKIKFLLFEKKCYLICKELNKKMIIFISKYQYQKVYFHLWFFSFVITGTSILMIDSPCWNRKLWTSMFWKEMLSYLQGAKQQEFRESQHVNYLMNESIIIRLLQKYSTTAPLGGLRGLRGGWFWG